MQDRNRRRRPCCPCGWTPKPENCDRVYEECRWCGLTDEECATRRDECRRRWEDWPFYRGPCPQSAVCDNFCSCVPLTAAHGLFTIEDELNIQAGENVPFTGDYLESLCVKRSWRGVRVERAGTYLVTVNLSLPATPGTRFFVTIDGEEVVPGSLPLTGSSTGLNASWQTIVTAGRDSVIGLTAADNVNLSGENLLVSMSVIRIA